MEIFERIQKLRKERGLSQEELAEALGVSRQAVSKWESGQSQPELDKILGLSQFFGISTDALLKEEDCEAPAHKTDTSLDRGTAIGLLYGAALFIGVLAGLAARLCLFWSPFVSVVAGSCVFLILGQLLHVLVLRWR